jgi:hypothetical protein
MTLQEKLQVKPQTNLLQIRPKFLSPILPDASFGTYIKSIEQLIHVVIPQTLFSEAKTSQHPEDILSAFTRLQTELPFLTYTLQDQAPCTISFTVLCLEDFVLGVGRFISDMLSRWLIPGKQLTIDGNRSLSFHFVSYPQKAFHLMEYYIVISNETELSLVKKNIDSFRQELKLNIMSVYQARSILAKKKLSHAEKSALIQENISTLFLQDNTHLDPTVFEEMQNLLIKLSAEKKLSEVEENIANLINKKPKTFDQDIFHSIHHAALPFQDTFMAVHDPKHISRIIGWKYLFRKLITHAIVQEPYLRHIHIKFLKTKLSSSASVLGLLVTLNFLHESERLDRQHVLEAIWYCIPDVQYIKDSFIADKREDKIRSFYIEIEKNNASSFSLAELKELRKKLPLELKTHIENVVHPIFMPRNEEEILRNMILLSKQIKYIKDLPQAIISYERQTGQDICFTVLLVRLLKEKTSSIKDLFTFSHTNLSLSLEEVKIIGYLKKKHPKEMNIFKITIKKAPFFRSDNSLDLQKARQFVVTELTRILGEFRDYNGGLIVKQSEALENLKGLMGTLGKKYTFLLETFFYSIRPGLMQTILCSKTLKTIFLLFLDILKATLIQKTYVVKSIAFQQYFLVMIGAKSPAFKEEIHLVINEKKIPSFDLSYVSLDVHDMSTLGYFYHSQNPEEHQLFLATIEKALDKISSH